MRYAIIILCVIQHYALLSQPLSKEDIIMTFGNGLSKAGIDSMIKYYDDDLLYKLEDKNNHFFSYDEKELIVHNFYQSKLNAQDLQVIDSYMKSMTRSHITETQRKAGLFRPKLQSLKKSIDSIEQLYLGELKDAASHIDLFTLFNVDEIQRIKEIDASSIQVAKNKREQILRYDAVLTASIDSAIYNYKAYSMDLLRKYPSTLFTKSCGNYLGDLTFADKGPLDQFFTKYMQFEDALAEIIRQNLVDIFYAVYRNKGDEAIFTKVNGILFILRQQDPEQNTTSTLNSSELLQRASISVNPDDFIDREAILSNNYKEVADDEGILFIREGANFMGELLGFGLLPEEKRMSFRTYFDDPVNQHEFKRFDCEALRGNPLFYRIREEQMNEVAIYQIEACLFTKDHTLMIVIINNTVDKAKNDLQQACGFIKFR